MDGESQPNRRGFTMGAALTVAGLPILFVLLRLHAVARYDWHTTFPLLQTLDLTDAMGIFLGTFMADERISSVLLAVLLPFTILYCVSTRSGPRRTRIAAVLLLVVLLAMLVALLRTYARWWVPIVAAVLLAALLILERARRQGWLQLSITFVLNRFDALVVAVALAVAALVSTPWVPLERVDTKEGAADYYVVATNPGYLKVLTADKHEFAILLSSNVLSRTIVTDR